MGGLGENGSYQILEMKLEFSPTRGPGRSVIGYFR